MFIDIPPHIEQMIVSQAQAQGISVAELITAKFTTTPTYPKGDIRRLKNIVQTNIKANIDEMNNDIAMGAVYGE